MARLIIQGMIVLMAAMVLIVDASVMVTVPGSTPKKKKGRKRCECESCYFDQFFWIT